MAKKGGKSKGYISKGSVGVNKYISKLVRADWSVLDRYNAQMAAFKKGKRVVFTIENPDPKQTNKRFIRVTGKDLLGDYREFSK